MSRSDARTSRRQRGVNMLSKYTARIHALGRRCSWHTPNKYLGRQSVVPNFSGLAAHESRTSGVEQLEACPLAAASGTPYSNLWYMNAGCLAFELSESTQRMLPVFLPSVGQHRRTVSPLRVALEGNLIHPRCRKGELDAMAINCHRSDEPCPPMSWTLPEVFLWLSGVPSHRSALLVQPGLK